MPEIVSLTRDTDWAIEAHDPINEMLKQLYQMINQLGQLDKSIILLYLEDKSYEEIAEITGLTVTNVATKLSRIKDKLKRMKKLGLVHPLTMYVARHSWASVARGKHIPLSVISEGMGHDSEKTTLIYLAALDTTVIDKANMVVLREFL